MTLIMCGFGIVSCISICTLFRIVRSRFDSCSGTVPDVDPGHALDSYAGVDETYTDCSIDRVVFLQYGRGFTIDRIRQRKRFDTVRVRPRSPPSIIYVVRVGIDTSAAPHETRALRLLYCDSGEAFPTPRPTPVRSSRPDEF
ncbi:hypothetical protein EVAR_4169_1 [Eumeta japonica]|uniref:Uncharacterized protein n=1 Tax=Eumeta variegata TaxID=151549 RepID=A0A4C1TJ31_EUMVA|nr:hypothetical protein EVAR_4169_1 [Eumeta japonica]